MLYARIVANLCRPNSTDPHRYAMLDLFVRLRDQEEPYTIGELV